MASPTRQSAPDGAAGPKQTLPEGLGLPDTLASLRVSHIGLHLQSQTPAPASAPRSRGRIDVSAPDDYCEQALRDQDRRAAGLREG
eukprot:SAG11_NODE_16459_length_546_cov_3.610738_1_plen_85_part_10